MNSRDIPSPCVGSCQLDPAGESCLSCRRTIKEIAGWPGYSNFDKQSVWNRLLALPPQMVEKRCPVCSAAFVCGDGGLNARCWCSDLPNIMPLETGHGDCLCPSCLKDAIGQREAGGISSSH